MLSEERLAEIDRFMDEGRHDEASWAEDTIDELVAEVRRLRDGIEGLAGEMRAGWRGLDTDDARLAQAVENRLRALLTDGSTDDDDR